MLFTISQLQPDDRDAWQRLYHGYAEFYKVPMNDRILDAVWAWIFDPDEPFYALVARSAEGRPIGFMHFRAMASPLRGRKAGFLDDLFVEPACRGSGVTDELFAALASYAREQGWPFVRWITAENNYRGRGAYDRISNKTHWLTYQLDVDA